ncbi:MAG: chlorite dismutase family protein [candidate division FCPU426 bacterium]
MSERPATDDKKSRIQVSLGFSSFQCWKVDKEWRRLDAGSKKRHVDEFVKAVEASYGPDSLIGAFSTAGLKADTDFIIWTRAKTIDQIHALGRAQLKTEFSKWAAMSHNYNAMLKGSPYEQEDKTFVPQSYYKYLFVYPFVKTRDWYLLPMPERMRIMMEHIGKSKAYDMVRINTSYSFGIDDQDFVVAFESDHADKFVNLVQDLRESESSKYTERDTPMYVGVQAPLAEILADF